MEIKLSKSDVIWSYISQFFNIGAGLITLPLILHMLSTKEIAMNYLMLVIGELVAMVDFGFSPQLSRNISYVFSGANKLLKEGIIQNDANDMNFHLLKVIICVAHNVYKYMAIMVLIILMSLGSWYIYVTTNAFTDINNGWYTWIVYAISVYFNIYYLYYSSLLIGRGQIKEAKKAMVASKIAYILISYVFLFCGLGLLGVCIANLISPFLCRFLSHYYFYDRMIKESLAKEKTTIKEEWLVFKTIWYNAKKTGISLLGGAIVLKSSLFIAGLYLTLEEVSSYGLMMQLVGLIAAVSASFCTALVPRMTSLCVNNDNVNLIKNFSWGLINFYIMYFIGASLFVFFGKLVIEMMGSNAVLPSISILVVYLLIIFLEYNHALFLLIVNMKNIVPQHYAVVISGIFICIFDLIVLKYTSLRIIGIVLVQGLVQLSYQNWRWPMMACRQLDVSYIDVVCSGIIELKDKVLNLKNSIFV